MEIWRKLAVQNGLKGIYFVGQGNMVHRKAILALGFNAFNDASVFGIQENKNDLYLVARKIVARLFKYPISYRYADAMKYWVHSEAKFDDTIPTIIPNWDHSPRSGAKGVILTGGYSATQIGFILLNTKNRCIIERIKTQSQDSLTMYHISLAYKINTF